MGTQSLPMTGEARDSLIAICVLWIPFAAVVCLRLWGRYRGAGIGIDDAFSVVACVLSGSTIGLNAAVFVAGVGYDFDEEIPEFPALVQNMEFIMQITFAFTLIYLWALAAMKLSQLVFYLRAFSVHTQLKRWTYAVGAIVATWGLVFTFVFIFLCHPVEQQWTLDRIGKCMDQILVLKCIIMTNVVTDLMIVVLPIKTVWGLQMRKTEKLAVISCFALGLACCVIGIVRFWQIFVIDLIGNLTGTSLTTFMLCTVELMLAGLCINIPMLRPFYLRWRERHKSSAQGQSDVPNNSSSHASQNRHLNPVQPKHGDYSAWIELNDKDQETGSNDDGDSQRKLTRGKPSQSGIQVSTDWAVTRG